MPSRGLCAQIACAWEVTARKPGNVHRFRDFADMTHLDFILSAAAVAPVLDGAAGRPVGAVVLDGIRATRRVVAVNTNLGILLLLAPLAAATAPDLRRGLGEVLDGLTVADARDVYAAIRLANPGGLGRVEEQDVSGEPTETLRAVMARAAGRDLVARQYADGFQAVFDVGVPALLTGLERTGSVEGAVLHAQLTLLTTYGDTLILRKRGPAEAEESRLRARDVLDRNWPHAAAGRTALADLDQWLRAEGHARNPGATADLVTASLYAALFTGRIPVPPPHPWTTGLFDD